MISYDNIRGFILDVKRRILYGKYTGPSVEEIAEAMKPVPYSEIEHKLPHNFARAVREIIDAEDSRKSLETKF